MIQLKRNQWIEESTRYYNDPPAPSAQESTDQTLGALIQRFPDLMKAYNAQVYPTAQAQLDSETKISPQYEQLMTDLYKQFAPQLAATGNQIDAASRTATANEDVNLLKNQGKELATGYNEIDRQLNPEYYATREKTANKLAELLGSVNLDDANPEAERLVNQENVRTGQLGNTSSTNTVANALAFGNEKAKRTATLSSAINAATSFLTPSQNTQFNPLTAVTGKPASNTGLSNFGGVTQSGQEAYSAGSGLLNTIAGFQNNAANINANRRDVLDRVNGTLSSL